MTSNKPLNLKSLHALNISLSFATPVGSTIILFGENLFIISSIEDRKSPDELQQIHPAVISSTSTPVFFNISVSIPTFPNSFSKTTIFSSLYPSVTSFFIRVVLPAPKNPDTISNFIFIAIPPLLKI